MRPVSLFGTEDLDGALTRKDREAAAIEAEERRKNLLRERALRGDQTSLREAHESGIAGLYDEILQTLIAQADSSDERLHALASFIAGSKDLRSSVLLAQRFLEFWKNAPVTLSTAEMLHLAALSNDATMYKEAVEAALQGWREEKITGLSVKQLSELIESEYWVLSPDAKRSGAGFILKQTLADARRQLHTTKRDGTTTTPPHPSVQTDL